MNRRWQSNFQSHSQHPFSFAPAPLRWPRLPLTVPEQTQTDIPSATKALRRSLHPAAHQNPHALAPGRSPKHCFGLRPFPALLSAAKLEAVLPPAGHTSLMPEIDRAANQRKASEAKRIQASIRGCKAICDWLIVERNSGVASVQIVEEARLILDICEQNNTLPRDVAPHGTPLLGIIKRTRPAQPNTDETSYVSWYARWLALWAAYSMTDSWVRYKAIELALEKQHRR